MQIDAHFHSWQLARGDYGWLTPAQGVIYRDVRVQDWQAVAQPLGVQAGVLVQAAPTLAETQYLLSLAAQHPCVLGVVGWVDMASSSATANIVQLAKNDLLKGLRPMLHDTADPDWILQAAVQPALELMAQLGLVFDALVKPVHLPRIRALAQRHPTLKIAIDHGAKPNIAAGAWQPWAQEIEMLAAQPGICCKLSGLLTEAGTSPPPHAAQRYAAHLLDCFGANRLIWGSDWPVLEQAATYEAWWNACQSTLDSMSAQAQQAVWGGNAQRLYGLQSKLSN